MADIQAIEPRGGDARSAFIFGPRATGTDRLVGPKRARAKKADSLGRANSPRLYGVGGSGANVSEGKTTSIIRCRKSGR
jgi:hypothetical protein